MMMSPSCAQNLPVAYFLFAFPLLSAHRRALFITRSRNTKSDWGRIRTSISNICLRYMNDEHTTIHISRYSIHENIAQFLDSFNLKLLITNIIDE